MPTFTFDFNGTPAVVTTEDRSLIFWKVPVYPGAVVKFNYIMLVGFMVGTDTFYLELRIFTETPSVRIYELANQGTLTDYADICQSNSFYMRMIKNGEAYNSDATSQMDITSISSAPEAAGTFAAELNCYRATPGIANSEPILSEPAIFDTISITNGVFANIPIQP